MSILQDFVLSKINNNSSTPLLTFSFIKLDFIYCNLSELESFNSNNLAINSD